jgi:hypothetical protein
MSSPKSGVNLLCKPPSIAYAALLLFLFSTLLLFTLLGDVFHKQVLKFLSINMH